MKRTPNSHECFASGWKLSNIGSGIQVSGGGEAMVGSERDDEIYDFVCCQGYDGKLLKERVKITIHSDDELYPMEIDLEDVIRFACRYCHGIVERVLEDVELNQPKEG